MRLNATKHKLILAASLLVFSLLGSGCGPSKGSLSGKVTLDGAPLHGGRVDFANKSGGPSATVEINDDGTYSVPILSGGDYAVTVTTDYLKAGSGGGGMNRMPGAMKGGGVPQENKAGAKVEMPGNPADYGYKASMPGDSAKKYVKIPSKYADPAESGLTYTFAGGSPTYDILLVGGVK